MSQKERKSQYTPEEVEIIVDEVAANADVLFAAHSDIVTNKTKNRTWQIIADRVSALNVTARSVADIRKKWTDIRHRTKGKEAERKHKQRKTGGGKAPKDKSNWINCS